MASDISRCPRSLGHFQYIESRQGQQSHGDFICPMTVVSEQAASMDFLFRAVKGGTISNATKEEHETNPRERRELMVSRNNEEQ